MQTIRQGVAKVYKAVVLGLACAIVFYLGMLSIFSTSYTHSGEKIYYIADSPWLFMLGFAALCAGLAVLRRFAPGVLGALASPRAKWVVLFVAGALAVAWVLGVQASPVTDQWYILHIPAQMREGNFSEFVPGGYMDEYPHQMGIVLLVYFFSFVVGMRNYLAFELLNVAALLVCYAMLYRINTLTGADKNREGIVLLASVLFLPLMMYTTFVYGTLLGFAFVLAGIWQMLLCLKAVGRKKQALHIALAAVLFGVGLAVKGNYLVLLVAAVITLLVYAFTHKRLVAAVCAGALAAGYVFFGWTTAATGQAITGAALEEGIPTSAWIAMGIQESPRAPGWFNTYVNSVYVVSDYSHDRANEAAVEAIRERVSEFAATPFYALEFFGMKTASQWNDPTFSSLWVNSAAADGVVKPAWAWGLINSDGAVWYMRYCNLFQGFVLLGALAGLVLRRKKHDSLSMYMALALIGGFILYLFWEAKGQYTVSLFYLLLPYAVEGYAALAARADDILRKLKAREITPVRAVKTRLAAFAAVLLLCVTVLTFTHKQVLAVTVKPAGDEEYYGMILQAYKNAKYQDYLADIGYGGEG